MIKVRVIKTPRFIRHAIRIGDVLPVVNIVKGSWRNGQGKQHQVIVEYDGREVTLLGTEVELVRDEG